MKNFLKKIEWQITLLYTLFGIFWIFLTDYWLFYYVQDSNNQLQFQNYKGWFFVLLSALLLFFTLSNALKRQRQAVAREQEIQERYQKIFETSMDAIFLVSDDGSIIAANSAACKMFGVTIGEITRMTRNDIMDVTDPRLEAGLEKRRMDGYFRGETTCIRKDRQKFPGEISSALFTDEKGQVFSTTIIRDISDLKKAQQELLSYNERLEAEVRARTKELEKAHGALFEQEKMATFGNLADSVAHELRNPLGVISNAVYYLKLILQEPDPKVKEYLRILDRESQAAVQIISDLLNYAKLQAGDRQTSRVSDLVQKVLSQVPETSNVQISTNISDSLPALYVDPRQIEQALGRLVENALQAMSDGGVLSIGAKRSISDAKKYVCVSITDTGTGILPENLPKIFKPLFSTWQHHIGLGLPLSQRLIEANGGFIEVKSKPGKGSTFNVFLPAKMEVSE